ncbi:DNA polymerase III subunit delta [Altererythrobacter aerius]|uniref:DNA-directed DNA polymerase n=1 Tax=Tsuneonella aeria TaxID=1837929 RepID=A0A6I4TG10_9SPHN|nr:DNA polymerase III subunit delta [Tsuneonella aeria]
MKATQKDFARGVPAAARNAAVFFFCGPDEAGAAAAAERIAAALVEPGERIDLAGGDLKRDPVLLGDEARSSSLFAGARHIMVRATGDEAHDAVANHLARIDAAEGAACPVLIVATAATDKARTAKLLEKRADALVAMFYPPDIAQIRDTIRRAGDELGLRISGEIADRLAYAAGLDIRLARSEVAKLALYLDADPAAPVTVGADALDAVGAKTEDDGLMPIVNAVLGGHVQRLATEIHRMRELSLNPVGLLLAFERRTAQLAQLNARMGPRGQVAAFVEAESQAKRVFWKEKKDLIEQLSAWRGPKLARLIARLVALHRDLMTADAPHDQILAQSLTRIAQAARR